MTKRIEMVRGTDNVFRDLGFRDGEARDLLLRSQIMICIEQVVERSGLNQPRAAALLGLTQRRKNALLKGKVDQLDLDALVNIATRAALHAELHVTLPKRAGGRGGSARHDIKLGERWRTYSEEEAPGVRATLKNSSKGK